MEKTIQHGLVYTNDNCIGCHKCISVCPVITANHAIELPDGTCRIEVDGSKCIACGACFDACEHHARDFIDDTEQFFEALDKGEQISVLWAPAFAANYPSEYERLLGGLKAKGVNHIISIGFGADITTWGYLKYITEHEFYGGISQPCPAIVNYIEHFAPELIPRLVPIHSPLMCGAIYVRKYMKITDKLAFISPCIAKKHEINDANTHGLVTYNVAFDHLMNYARRHSIFAEPVPNEIEYGLGSIYPMPGGLAENVRWFLGDELFIRQIEGEKRAYHFLNEYKIRAAADKELPFMVDALNCSAGCLYGTGVEEKEDSDDMLYALMHIKEARKNNAASRAWDSATPTERLNALNEQFADLDINDFIRHYTDKSAECKIIEPSDDERQKIFALMKKDTKEKRRINCSACGYETCSQMTTAIFNGCNRINNCVHFSKDVIKEENNAVTELLGEIANEAATSTARTHYMEGLYTELEQDITRWTRNIDIASKSDDSLEKERILIDMKNRGHGLIDFIQDTLVSIRRTSQSLNLKESVYSPKELVAKCVEHMKPLYSQSQNIIAVDIGEEVPRLVFGDTDRVFNILTLLLGEMARPLTGARLSLSVNAVKHEYANYLQFVIETPEEVSDSASYERFSDYLRDRAQAESGLSDGAVKSEAENTAKSETEHVSESELAIVDTLLGQLFGRLKYSRIAGKGCVCTISFPQLDAANGN